MSDDAELSADLATDGIACTWMRGGTSKGGFFLAQDLPTNKAERDAVLLSIMGSPDARQIDGMGGADPLTSKVAIVSPSARDNIDVDYLFLQVFVDEARVTDAQGCGNMLAGVGGFAIEKKLVNAIDDVTSVSIYMINTDSIAVAQINTPARQVSYTGDASIDGVPGTSAAVSLIFKDIAGANCGSLLPTGDIQNTIDNIAVTLIDNGMPTVLLKADDFGISGYETREELDANDVLKSKLESIRLQAGPMMNLGDVSEKSVPKMTLLAPAKNNGVVMTRTFIPHRCHATIGVFCAVSVATACILQGSVAFDIATPSKGLKRVLDVEHPLGETSAILNLKKQAISNEQAELESAGMLRTARKLFEGTVYPA